MRIGVVGAGAIGGFIAAALARAGISVAIVARGAHLAAIRAEGLHVESDLGTFAARVEAADDLRELGAFDMVFLTFKAHQWPALLEQLEPFAGSTTTIVTMQNGVPFWYVRTPPLHSVDPNGRIGRLFADEQIAGGVVHVSGHIVRHGVIKQSGGTRYVIGPPTGGTNERSEAVVQVMKDAGLAPELDDNVRQIVWLKLVNNAGLNPVSALRRLSLRALLEDAPARAEARTLMVETLAVGQALGVVREVDIDARLAYAGRLEDVKTSMLQDYESNRPLELDPILGAVIELAGRVGVEVPHLRRAYDALHASTVTR